MLPKSPLPVQWVLVQNLCSAGRERLQCRPNYVVATAVSRADHTSHPLCSSPEMWNSSSERRHSSPRSSSENERELSFIYEPTEQGERGSLRPIVIDGSNVAYCHGDDKDFSMRGIEIVVDDFNNRGYEKEKIVVVLPQKRHLPEMLKHCSEKCSFCFVPSRRHPGGEVINFHDDFYILNYAAKVGAVVVTRDSYRNHANNPSHPEWDEVISNRILVPKFVRDVLLWPEDPLGRNGPRFDEFLKF